MAPGSAGPELAAIQKQARGLKFPVLIRFQDILRHRVESINLAFRTAIAEFRAGKEKAFNSLVGKAMAASKGKANPAQVNAVLKAKLGAAQ